MDGPHCRLWVWQIIFQECLLQPLFSFFKQTYIENIHLVYCPITLPVGDLRLKLNWIQQLTFIWVKSKTEVQIVKSNTVPWWYTVCIVCSSISAMSAWGVVIPSKGKKQRKKDEKAATKHDKRMYVKSRPGRNQDWYKLQIFLSDLSGILL